MNVYKFYMQQKYIKNCNSFIQNFKKTLFQKCSHFYIHIITFNDKVGENIEIFHKIYKCVY